MPGTLQARLSDIYLNAFRIVFGLMFWQHGAQKLFGMFGAGHAVDTMLSLSGVAGVLEFGGGLLIILGLLTRPTAFLLSGEMAVAYFKVHFPRGWVPIMNRGEVVVLFCFAFLYLSARGGGTFSLDAWLAARRAKAAGT